MARPDTHELIEDGKAIRCLHCLRISREPADVLTRYCPYCHAFHPFRPWWNDNKLSRRDQHDQ